MRRVLVCLAVLGASLMFGLGFQSKPADAATYCAPWQNWFCYQHYLKCGPWIPIYWNNGQNYALTDRCGGFYL